MTREEAILCLKGMKNYARDTFTEQTDWQTSLDMAIKALEQEPKTGHWILTDDDFVYCSECEDSYYQRPIDASWYYCPHCGAKMEGMDKDE